MSYLILMGWTRNAPLIDLADDATLRAILQRLGVVVVSKDAVTIRYHAPFRDFVG